MGEWKWRVIAGEDAGFEPIFAVIVKRSFQLVPGRSALPVGVSRELVENDEYFDDGDPLTTSLQFETELVPYKLGTDIVFIGKAHAPSSRPVRQMTAALSVGSTRKELLLTGNRVSRFRSGADPTFTEPEEFTSMDVRYEYAYGGVDDRSLPDIPVNYPRNPIGRGFVLRNTCENVEGLPLPNIEDPRDALTPDRLEVGAPTNWNRQPLPQGFGWFHRAWYPRCSFLAAMPAFVPVDEVMRESAYGLVPPNQAELAAGFRLPSRDPRFFSGGSLGLVLPYLRGDETITLENLTPEGTVEIKLPGETPKVALDIGFGERELRPVLHSVTVLGEMNELDLVWRAELPYPGVEWLPEMKRLRATVE